MRNSGKINDRIEQAFRGMRSEMENVGSSRMAISRRIAATSMDRAPAKRWEYAIAASGLLALSVFVWWRSPRYASRPRDVTPTMVVNGRTKVELPDAELTEYIAGITEGRSVIVIWSFRGEGVGPSPQGSAECTSGRYRLTTIRETRPMDGRTVVLSLLTPDADISPVLEPPSIGVHSGAGRVIALSVWPRRASAADIAEAIRSAGADGQSGFSVEAVLQEVHKQIHRPTEAHAPRKDAL